MVPLSQDLNYHSFKIDFYICHIYIFCSFSKVYYIFKSLLLFPFNMSLAFRLFGFIKYPIENLLLLCQLLYQFGETLHI